MSEWPDGTPPIIRVQLDPADQLPDGWWVGLPEFLLAAGRYELADKVAGMIAHRGEDGRVNFSDEESPAVLAFMAFKKHRSWMN
jgi:hypothetical protein